MDGDGRQGSESPEYFLPCVEVSAIRKGRDPNVQIAPIGVGLVDFTSAGSIEALHNVVAGRDEERADHVQRDEKQQIKVFDSLTTASIKYASPVDLPIEDDKHHQYDDFDDQADDRSHTTESDARVPSWSLRVLCVGSVIETLVLVRRPGTQDRLDGGSRIVGKRCSPW